MSTDTQIELFEPGQVEETALATMEKGGEGVYTLERIKKHKPDIYAAAKRMLIAGAGICDTAKALGMHTKSVMAIRDETLPTIASHKVELAKRFSHVSVLALDDLEDRLSDKAKAKEISAKDLGVIAGIAGEKTLLFSDQATVRVQVDVSEPTHADLEDWLTGLCARAPGQEGAALAPGHQAEPIDITPHTSSTLKVSDNVSDV